MKLLELINNCFEYIMSNNSNNMYNSMNYILIELSKYIKYDFGFIGEKIDNGLKFHGIYSQNDEKKKYLSQDILDRFENDRYLDKLPVLNYQYLYEMYESKVLIKYENIKDDCASLNTYYFPLLYKDKIIGLFGILSNESYSDDIINHLNSFVKFISNQIININNVNELELHKLSFIANMSHEVRTPLNGIVSMIDILSKTELTELQIKYIDIIKNCNIQLLDIVNDILDYSKIITNGMKMKLLPIHLNKILESVESILSYKAKEKSLEIKINIDNHIPDMIIADPTRLKQVLINVISNSIKFTKVGEITIDITIKEMDENECIILFKVTDSGIGIPEDKLLKVFDSFRQIDNNYLSDICGVGLGLPITKHIVEMFKGKIWIESKLNVGTTVNFFMKFSLYKNEINKEKLKSFYNDKYALLIDADLSERILLFDNLAEVNIKPIMVGSVEEAIIYLTKITYNFEFIILNINGLTDNDIIKINNVKNKYVRIIIVDIGKKNINNINYDYKLTRPIDNNKLLYLLNIIYITNQYQNINNKNEIIISGENTHINNLNVKQIESNKNNIKIIVAEDNIYNQEVIVNILNFLNFHNIKIVSDGFELLNNLIEHNYDIAFVDLKMPIKDGITAIKEFKQLSNKTTIIVAVTASLSDKIKKICFDAEFNGFITKPIDINSVEKIMNLVINKKDKSL